MCLRVFVCGPEQLLMRMALVWQRCCASLLTACPSTACLHPLYSLGQKLQLSSVPFNPVPVCQQEWQTLMDAGSGDWKESVQLVRRLHTSVL